MIGNVGMASAKSVLDKLLELSEKFPPDSLYALRESDTGELHIFLDRKNGTECTTNGTHSLCKNITLARSPNSLFRCRTEADARINCASTGRAVCGGCVVKLYTTY
ncbi:conserved hypothetical protein [Agrobacterium fabacearum CFBP 5771]|nr:conserved hypothetical protein [Agrobacterium fabacearum CFBP 5771]